MKTNETKPEVGDTWRVTSRYYWHNNKETPIGTVLTVGVVNGSGKAVLFDGTVEDRMHDWRMISTLREHAELVRHGFATPVASEGKPAVGGITQLTGDVTVADVKPVAKPVTPPRDRRTYATPAKTYDELMALERVADGLPATVPTYLCKACSVPSLVLGRFGFCATCYAADDAYTASRMPAARRGAEVERYVGRHPDEDLPGVGDFGLKVPR